jgi:hypothetical protein
MPLIRYEVTLPAQARCNPTAWAPVPASTTSFWSAAQAQGWTVTGQPGTRRIPAPYSDVGVPSGPGSPLPGGAGGGGATGSRYMPPAWFPSQYYARQQLAGSIGGVRAGWLVNARQGPAGWPVPTRAAVPTTVQPGMRPHRMRQLLNRQVASSPNAPRWPRWGGRRRG